MEEHGEAVEQPKKKSYEGPTLIEREDLLQIAEGPVLAAISEGVPVV
jgi:hypothetical protein